jgi:CRISPR-associated protein (TIGR03984 family)
MASDLKNGLELKNISSTHEPFPTDSSIWSYVQDKFGSERSFIVAYLDYKVLIGTYENGNYNFQEKEKETVELKYIQRLRVFNDTKELHLWRTSEGLKGRLRMDSEGVGSAVVDAYQVLFGTRSEPSGNYTRISEERGTELFLPFQDLEIDVKKEKKSRIAVKTRNYIDYNNVFQATYIDCRLMGFYNDDKELI